ncbi:MAG: succinate dehydrogenase iron-sulfur subunit [Chloroflexi bacterium]|nr:succinate dehydrogenase iron-sulfur subunit [Chloroflexota bacterium]
MEVTLRIRRYNPEADEAPHWEEYDVEAEATDRVLDLLHQVKWYQDGTLTFRRSCAHGVCGSDAMLINGRNVPVIKDLLVDMEPFWEKYRRVMPFLVNDEVPADGKERRQSPADRDRYEDTSRCILCAACTTSCPVFWTDEDYVGPAAIVNAHRFIVDSRDTAKEERLQIMADADGVWRCRTVFNCVEACPRDINITRAILEVTSEIGKASIS